MDVSKETRSIYISRRFSYAKSVPPFFFISSLINWLNLRNVLAARNTSERDAVPVDISCLYDYVQELALSCLITLNTSERDAVSVDISFLIISIQDLALSCLIILK